MPLGVMLRGDRHSERGEGGRRGWMCGWVGGMGGWSVRWG